MDFYVYLVSAWEEHVKYLCTILNISHTSLPLKGKLPGNILLPYQYNRAKRLVDTYLPEFSWDAWVSVIHCDEYSGCDS